ncbi:hypothetical protein CVT26_015459 [Gymnopilus dilepis]|uniref:Uncharacterized protein n=1 Tax=Gymnopilus dilepis TaxID=231916 RepID=A0A409W4E5_9AGAR|nr:hypothetical protein CVT26_015459 [Gymnopilus dilepis]
MTLPTIFGGRASAIVDEEMGQAPAFVDESTATASAASQQPDQSGHQAGSVESGIDLLAPSSASTATATVSLPSHTAQETAPVATEPSSVDAEHAARYGTRRKRNRGSDPQDAEPRGAGPSQIQAAPQTGGRYETIEEVDEYGVRTKIRLTLNEAVSRQRIQERDEVAAQRDAIAREQIALVERIRELEAALASIFAQSASLDQAYKFEQLPNIYIQASQVAAHYDAEVKKIKAETMEQIAFFQQAVDFKNRMVTSAANHSRILNGKSGGRGRPEKHRQLQNEIGVLKDQLKDALSRIQQVRQQSEAQVEEKERLKKLNTEMQSALDRQARITPANPQPGAHARLSVEQQATGRQPPYLPLEHPLTTSIGRPIIVHPPPDQPRSQSLPPQSHLLPRDYAAGFPWLSLQFTVILQGSLDCGV